MGDVITRDGEGLYGFVSVSHHTHFHLGAFLAFQTMHGFLVGDNLSHERLVVNTDYLVAGQQSRTFCRTVFDDALDVDGVFADDKLHADARE